MMIAIDIVLSIVTLSLGVLAIGGETWDKTQALSWRCITAKGWICVTLLVLTFLLGVTKLIVESKASERNKRISAQRVADFIVRNQQLENMLAASNRRLLATPRFVTSATVQLKSGKSVKLPFKVRAEDILEYTVMTGHVERWDYGFMGGSVAHIESILFAGRLEIGGHIIPLTEQGGRLTVPGSSEKQYEVIVEAPRGQYDVKIALYSTRD
jgi:hypothetical protein